jgi:ribonuclease HI/exonuclease III
MKVVSWNCRGMGNKVKEEAVRSLIRIETPDILLIQETKMEGKDFLQVSKKFWKKGGGLAVSARGASGGLGSLWNNSKYSLITQILNDHWLYLKLQLLDTKEVISLFNVYALVNAGEKKACWDSIRNLAETENVENVIIAGDLNLTLLLSEKRGGNIVRSPAREWVEDLMQEWDLLDIKPSNGKYTWSNKRIGPGHIAARLDRFLVQSSFLLLGLEASMHILPCSVSDHKPIKLEFLAQQNLGPIPFRFSPLWVKEPDFMKKVKESWREPVKGSPFFIWEEKLRRVKVVLKSWAKTLPNPASERKQAQASLELHQLQTESAEITKEILDREAELQQKYHKACLSEEEYWRQKSRSIWLKAGDRNTSFFHKQAQARRNFNSISEIKEDATIHKDFISIKRATSSHFKNLYNEEGERAQNSKFLDVVPSKITNRMNQILEAKVTKEEIKAALFAMEPDKTPGPDGFTARFLQNCWQIVEKDLHKLVLKSQACQKIGGSTNSAFLALIPKEKGANAFNRFRPISLCNIGYKLITKVIANRLKSFLPSIIPENQGGFVHGRQIGDNFILVQEAINSSLLRKEKGMVVKLDLANAFDRVRHSFLFDVLHKFGFGINFINWIRACISEPWIAPLVNGRATDFFKASRGLRQGCPLSPLLFVLQAYVLSFYLEKKQLDQEIMGLNIARGVKNINHALFADDSLLLGATNLLSASRFKGVLDDYCDATGSILNKGKCHIYCWNVPVSTLNAISRCLGFAASSNWSSFKYLGLPIFQKAAFSRDWLPLLENFKLKIQAWGFSWLNHAGKTMLIKVVLSSLPIFQFSVMLAPICILKKMEDYIRKFFWKGGKQNEKRIPLVSWDKVTKPLLEGGLNFKDLSIQNVAMGAKQIWRIIAPKPGWAQTVLWKKYFRGQRKRCLDNPLPKAGSHLLKLCAKATPLINLHAYWIPGNGKLINIWEDNIMNTPPLAEISSLHVLRDWMVNVGFITLWDISCWEDCNWIGWKKLQVPLGLKQDCDTFFTHLKGMAPIHARRQDKRGWGSQSGSYTVALGYAKLLEQPHVPPNPATWKGLWGHKTIPKIDFFCWLMCHNRILTGDRLKKRGLQGPSRCIMCLENEENLCHLMLECNFAQEIWNEALGPWRNALICPTSIADLFATWLSNYPGVLPKNESFKVAWLSLPKIICWQIWLERNKRIFRVQVQEAKLVSIKIKNQLKESLGDQLEETNLSQQDIEWGERLGLQFAQAARQSKPSKEWQIRLKEKDFSAWLNNHSKHTLLFDGAAKGNPGKAGAGGVIKNPVGRIEHSFAWGLGHNTSIQAEALALFQGLKQVKDLGIKEVNVIGDSQSIIKVIVDNSAPKDFRLARLATRIKSLTKSFQSINFFHVLRENNKDADAEANKAALLSAGTLLRDRDEDWDPIP